MKTQTSARLHQFRDTVALSFPDTEQLYLTPKMANQLANELKRFAKNANANDIIATRTVDDNGKAVTESTQKSKVEKL